MVREHAYANGARIALIYEVTIISPPAGPADTPPG
jgi:hypothetical protein